MTLIYVDQAPKIDVRGEMAVVTFISGKDEHSFICTFHALVGLMQQLRPAVNQVCENTRTDHVLDFPQPKKRKPKR